MKQQSLKIFLKEKTGPYELPKGWRWVRLGDKDLFHIETGSTPKTDVKEYWQNGNIKWITPKDLGKLTNKFIFDTERKITQDGLNSCSTTIIPKGSIIISTRAPIGHIAICDDEMCFNQGCKGIVIKNKNQVLNDFLYYVLLTKVKEMDALGSGATFKEISRKKLASIQIPLPPLPEQKRIVARIEALFSKIDEIKRLRKEANDLAKPLLQSALHEVFSKADEKGWKWVRLGDKNIAKIIMGQSPPSTTYNQDRIGLPFYQGKTDFGDLYPSPRIWCSIPNKIAESGDILISVRAPVGPVNMCREKSCIGRGLAAIRPTNQIDNFFLFYYFKYIEGTWTGRGSTFGAIKKRELENLQIPLPPLPEQKRIITYLDNIQQKVQTLQKFQEETEKEIEKLRETILYKAFRGEL